MAFLLKVSLPILAEALTIVPHPETADERWLALSGAVLFVLGLTCDAYLLARFANARRAATSDPPLLKVGPKLWDVHDLYVGAAICIGLILLSNSFYGLVVLWTHQTLEDITPLVVSTELFLRVAILIGFIVFFHRRRIEISTALGLRDLAPLRAAAWGTVFGFASLPPVGILIAANDAVCRRLGLHPSDQPMSELFATTDSPLLLGVLVLFAVVIAPIFEEFMFRGFAYPALKQRVGAWRALAIVSVVFAVSHVHAPSLIPLFVLSLGLGLAYEWTGSLLAPITMHALFNAIMVTRLFLLRSQT